ncbi:TadE/TadG family type IV pilus assembly protein [Arthrobacter crystallopoietes]|uniref:Flp pilus assembly protein TadG n=1 Tax=Crystallibacter crystallopoietes TaxID=37928 RepID=A0A1H1F3Q9_9MICC|nr:TadE/TadG family type IV pilus assembly protein [Arthrobacter crystallopoietes]AUI49656.1 hypothetical protein AC20117_01340 [Arthrobacter crystallopoietes]SDQ95429.1 Flp pilus assembly protein TadG [Arthrobacter crystallopoietes]
MRKIVPGDGVQKHIDNSEDRGTTAVIVAILLVILLGFAAIVIDIGRIFAERSQLQNGADSAALSVAYSCGDDSDSLDCNPSSHSAVDVANANALDGLSNLVVNVDKSSGVVKVEARAREVGQTPGFISMTFARVIGQDAVAVTASATAMWGNPVKGLPPFPVVFSKCEIQSVESLQLVRFRQQGTFSPGCAGGPPGGFGNLDQLDGRCEANVDISQLAAGSSTGNGVPANCSDLLKSWATSIQGGEYPIGLFPVYDSVSESGSKAIYNLTGFAAFEIHGWKLKQGGSEKYPELFRADYYTGLKCDKDCIGVIGKFVRHVSLDENFTVGTGGKDMGAYLVRLTD